MALQAEFLKSVRDNLNTVQAKATARIESLNGSARKMISDVVEKGKHSQKDLSERLSKIAPSDLIQQKVKPAAEQAMKRATEVGNKAKSYVNAAAASNSVKKVTERLNQFRQKTGQA